jgi:hypothetical protein
MPSRVKSEKKNVGGGFENETAMLNALELCWSEVKIGELKGAKGETVEWHSEFLR